MDDGDGVIALRQHLKETIRARLRKETPSDATSGGDNNRRAYQGQFFGPSETVVSDRVIQLFRTKKPDAPKMPYDYDNKFLLKHKENSTFKKLFRDEKSTFGSSTKNKKVQETKSEINGNNKDKKLKFLRQARDYSVLFAETGTHDLPGPDNKARKNTRPEVKARNITKPDDKARIITRPEVKARNIIRHEDKARNITRPDDKARKITRPDDKARNITKPEDKAGKFTRPYDKARNITRPDDKARKITRPDAKARKIVSKGLVVGKAVVSKQSQPCSRLGKEKSTSEMAYRATKRKQPEGRRHDDISKEGAKNAIGSIIRQMFNYDPTKYGDDRDDDLRMEASFRDIEKEERRSAKIAKMEDAEELRKLSIATA